MSAAHENPFAELERVFHEPNRLAIMSELVGAVDGMTFTQLRDACQLTDGNLSRHLKTLAEAGAVRIEKTFVGAKPRTTVHLAEKGRASFLAYLEALEAVLQRAASAASAGQKANRLNLALGEEALDHA